MRADILTLALIVGLFTWAFRFFPTRADLSAMKPDGMLSRFLAATGPAAIATLVVASVLPLVAGDRWPLVAGVVAVLMLWVWRRSVVLATLGGAVAYGAVFAVLA